MPRVMRATIDRVASRPSRFSASLVTAGWLPKEATKVGRAVIKTKTPTARHPIERKLEQFQRRRVDPMCVFNHPEYRPVLGEPHQLIEEDCERAVATLLQRQRERTVTSRSVDAHERRRQRRGLTDIVHGSGQKGFESIQTTIETVIIFKARGVSDLLDRRVERAVYMIRRALIAQ